MRILFLLTHAGLFRNFDSTLHLIAERGRSLHVSFDSERYPSDAFARLVEQHEGVSSGFTPPVADDAWAALGRHMRAASDYIRYLEPRYAAATKLRARAHRQVPPLLRDIIRPGNAAAVDRRLRAIERRLPLSPAAVAFLREQAPDVVVMSLLFGSAPQLEVLRAARSMGIPTCLSVASWDNLTNKGLIRLVPDRVAVWNEVQRREAVELHGVPAERVVITGAQNFDEWFDRAPSTTPDEFRGRLGLDPERPYILYLGSSSFIAPDEVTFVAEWLRHLRASGHPALRDAGVLLRPHPQNARHWDGLPGEDPGRSVVWPPPGLAPQQTGRADWSRDDFYDSMAHAAAVVGVNTTAMIESGVLGKPVHTLLHPQFRETQGGTLHFEYLRSANGGLLHIADSFDEHLEQIAAALARGDQPDERSRRFVEGFVRPHGLDRPATPNLVDAFESTARLPAPVPEPVPSTPSPAMRALAIAVGTAERWRARRPKKGKAKRKPPRRRSRSAGRVRGLLLRSARLRQALER